ncbi:zf-TFIIB domain-containing protein [Altererythrobacter aquiaggeris]|uniref:TFIIB-type zinc ribbon-containing protein n=1 Tax=Aestuarierythrobacter aquiaggeris TaxID=1898396 RepID=UPI003AFAB578
MRTHESVASMLCPVCKTGLSMADRSGVEIDFCPTCRGVWLDRGELDKIIDRTQVPDVRETAGMRAPENRSGERRGAAAGGLLGMAASLMQGDDDRYDRSRDVRYNDHYDKRRPKKKKSLLSEFFD